MNKRQENILSRLNASAIKDEKLKKLNMQTQELIDLTAKKLDLLKDLKIAYCIEYSQKNYVVVVGNEIFESDNSMTEYELRCIRGENKDLIKIYETKKSKAS